MVLIDEIDKAPRDVPNDLLSEIDQGEFRIPELEVALQREIRIGLPRPDAGDKEARLDPLVVITSNSEKVLPEAFLRRCVYFHVPFPPFRDDPEDTKGKDAEVALADQSVTVERIVERRFYDRYRDERDDLVRDAISLFKFIRRDFQPDRRLSMAELLNWLDYLLRQVETPGKRLLELDPDLVSLSIRCLLLKQKEDQMQIDRITEGWKEQRDRKGGSG